MENNYTYINYTKPNEHGISKQEYLNQTKKMIIKIIKNEPTVVLHSDQEILEKYEHGVIATQNYQIVGNANLYPTQMSELKNLIHPEIGLLNIGELGSVFVDEDFRHHNIGKNMISHTIKELSSRYDAVVSATVNDCMARIFDKHGFIQIPFPKEYFQEGLTYLGPKMPGGVEEFSRKARCFMLFNKDIREYILEVLNNGS